MSRLSVVVLLASCLELALLVRMLIWAVRLTRNGIRGRHRRLGGQIRRSTPMPPRDAGPAAALMVLSVRRPAIYWSITMASWVVCLAVVASLVLVAVLAIG